MGECKTFDSVVITRKQYTVPEHKMRVWKCIDPPTNKTKRKRKGGKKRKNTPPKPSARKQRKAAAPKNKTVEPTYEDESLQDIEPIRQFKARPARKFASTFPGFY